MLIVTFLYVHFQSQSLYQSINQSINQSVNQSINQSINAVVVFVVFLMRPLFEEFSMRLLVFLKLFQITRDLRCQIRQDFGFFFDVSQTVTITSNHCLSNKSGNNEQKLQN